MAYEDDIPIVDLDMEGIPVVDLDKIGAMGKPRPRPKPRPKGPAHPPRKPIKPIKVTPDVIEASQRVIQDEYTRRLLRERSKTADSAYTYNALPGELESPYMMSSNKEALRNQTEYYDTLIGEELKRRKTQAVRRAALGKRLHPFEQEMIRQPVEMETPAMPDVSPEKPGRLRSDVNALLASFLNMGPEAVEGAAEIADFVGNIGQSEQEARASAIAPSVRKYTRDASSFIRGSLPTNEDYIETPLMSGLGSAGGFLAGGLAGKALKIPSMVTTAFMGASINVADVLREADVAGIDPQKRNMALVLAAGTGLTEMAGLGKTIEGFGLQKVFYKRLFEVAEEGGQEGLQQWLNNINAAVVGAYAPDRPLTKDVLQSIIVGGAVGGVVQVGSYGYQKLSAPRKTATPPVLNPNDIATIPPVAIKPPTPLPPGRKPSMAEMGHRPTPPMWDMALMSKGIKQDVVTDPNEREDNLLEFLRESQGFHQSGDPIAGYHPSIAPGEPSTLRWAPAAEGFGSGWVLYQDPELATKKTDKGWMSLQDYQDHPAYEGIKNQFLEEEIQKWQAENPGKTLTDMGRRMLEHEAGIMADDETKRRYQDDESPNLRPYHFDIRNAFDQDKMYGVDAIQAVRQGLIDYYKALGTFAPEGWHHRIDEFLLIPEDEILDGVEPGITGEEIYTALDEELRKFDKVDLGYKYYANPGNVNNVLQRAGFDGLTFIKTEDLGKPLSPKEFNTLEEARAYADKVGGRLEPFPGVVVDQLPPKTEWVSDPTIPGGGSWTLTDVPPTLSKGPTVFGSRVWIAWKGTQLKSATGNTGEFSPTDPRVYKAPSSRVQTLPKEGVPHGRETVDDFAFDVMPSLSSEYGRAPYLRAPGWFFDAIGATGAGGINYDITDLHDLVWDVRMKAPTLEHGDVAVEAMHDLADQVREEGLNSLSFMNTDERRKEHRGIIEHEVVHAAERADLTPMVEWVESHPLIEDILNRKIYPKLGGLSPTVRGAKFGEFSDEDVRAAAAMEIPAYWAQDKSSLLKMTEAEGRQFFKDYINHIRTEYGQEGVDKFRSIVRLRQEAMDVIDESDREWKEWQQQRGNATFWTPRSPAATPSVMYAKGPRSIWVRIKDTVRKVFTKNIRPGDSPGTAELELEDGSIVQFDLSDLQEEGGRKVEDPIIGMIKDDPPIPPLPPPPRIGRADGGGSLFKRQVDPVYNKLLTRTFIRMLEDGRVRYDPLVDPFLQVGRAIREGRLKNVDIDTLLEEEGIDWEEFSRLMEGTASDAGRTLQNYSEIARFWDHLLEEAEIEQGGPPPITDVSGKEPSVRVRGPKSSASMVGPRTQLAELIVPLNYRIRKSMKAVEDSILGRSMWQRMGTTSQKAMLTQMSTFVVNAAMASGQISLGTASQGIGAFMQQMAEGQGSFSKRIGQASDAFVDGIAAGLEVLMTFNPRQLETFLAKNARPGIPVTGAKTEYEHYRKIIFQLEKAFPFLHSKLFALSTGTETLAKGAKHLRIAQQLVDRVQNQDKREKLLRELQVYEDRLESNLNGLGKVIGGIDTVYDFFLQPMQFTEYLFRRPIFVGQLVEELRKEGINFYNVLARNQLHTIPRELLNRSVNKALEFTFAYMPGEIPDPRQYRIEREIEKAAGGAIRWIGKWGGPANALFGEPFTKALFNAVKFSYEYSPLGGVLPFGRIMRNMSPELQRTITDPKTKNVIPLNPTTSYDWERLAKAMVGTMMWAVAYFMRVDSGGEEWWQVKTGKKMKDGRPVYQDARRLKPFASQLHLMDIAIRMKEGRMGDKELVAELVQAIADMRLHDSPNLFVEAGELFRGEPSPLQDNLEEQIGRRAAIYLTPLLNIRDGVAQFVEEENVKKDTRGEGWYGPVLEKIPFVRRTLPNQTSPTEPSPIPLSMDPLQAQLTGYKEVPGENFVGREWRRLGLLNKSFIQRDPDPAINRAQNEAFQSIMGAIGSGMENDPGYASMADKDKAALWDRLTDKARAKARKIGLAANPNEAVKRKAIDKMDLGPQEKKALEVDKMFPWK